MNDKKVKKTNSTIDKIFDGMGEALYKVMEEMPALDLSKVNKSTYKKKEGTYDIDMRVEYTDEKAYPIFDKELWRKVTKYLIKRCKFIEFSCWHTDIDKIKEIERKMKKYEKIIELNQVNVRGEITEEVIELVTERFLDEKGNIKWFHISLYESEDTNSTIFHANHYGTNYMINELEKEDLEYIKTIINEDEIQITDVSLN